MMIKKKLTHLISFVLLLNMSVACSNKKDTVKAIESPDKKLKVEFNLKENGIPAYVITYDNKIVLDTSRLGVIMEDADLSKNLTIEAVSDEKPVKDEYEMLNGKKRKYQYEATEKVISLKNNSGQKLNIIFRVSNDGVALRYYFPDSSSATKKITEELTSYNFLSGTKGYLQPMSKAKTGWEKSNPSYEEHYMMGIDVGTPSPLNSGWVYPALFQSGNTWYVVTEASLDRNYCATRLDQKTNGTEYFVTFPQPEEVWPGKELGPESTLPWYSPWRIITIGNLKTIAESTLGTDLAKSAINMDMSFVKPGQAAWSWAIMKDDSTVYDVQKRFIDYASDMQWEYCLIDADWDKKIGYEKAKELADYAKTKNVGVLLWYNSAGDWNTTPYSPRNMLLTRESRQKEFARLEEMGIKGIKVDFFGGDGQSMIQYYLDIFEDAAKYKLMVNCHGATLPRGWQRTYPNLMTIEAIKGFEFITFDQQNADLEASHCAMLPFSRNVFDPMDFTPMVLHEILNIKRKTSNGFQLALPVLFLSGIQHLVEIPQGMTTVPDYVKEYLRNIPSSWDETRFIDGFPGKLAIIARRAENTWYVAGINGENVVKDLDIDLSFIGGNKKGILIGDGEEEFSFKKTEIISGKSTPVSLKANGGFLLKF